MSWPYNSLIRNLLPSSSRGANAQDQILHMLTSKGERGRASQEGRKGGYEALQSMLTGEYTEESTGARTIRQTGGKDRHSKVFTSRGARDRRVRLSVATAIRFYDLQDRLGFEQPSKAVEWLLLHCQPSIQALPKLSSLHPHARIAALPQSAHICDHPPPHNIQSMELKSSHDDHITHYDTLHNHLFGQNTHHKQETNQGFWKLNQWIQPLHVPHDHSLHTHPLYDAHAVQENSFEEDPPQSSNPSSSGASSDHPISLSKLSHNHSSKAAISTEAIPMFGNHATSLGIPQSSNQTTAPSILCSDKKRKMHSPSSFSQDPQAHSDYYASFASNENYAGSGAIMQAIGQRGSLLTDERLLGTNNLMSHTANCSNIGLNTGIMHIETPATNYSLLSSYMNMSSNQLPLCNQQLSSANVLLSNSVKDQQRNVLMHQNMERAPLSSLGEVNKYVDIAMLRVAEVNDAANETGSLQLMSGNMDDTRQHYGKMATRNMNMCVATYSLSPSESNNNIELATGLDIGGKSSSQEMQANDEAHDQQLLYRANCEYWA